MNALAWTHVAALSFVGSHFLLSHPLRAPLVARLGAGGFMGLYSLVAFATMGWMVWLWRGLPDEAPYWVAGDALWAVATAVMLIGSVLFVGSLIGNPALPDPRVADRPVPEARGVFAITRHPMMWGFALWGFVHIAVLPTRANIVLCGTIIVLALVGAALQDGKKRKLMPEYWRVWQARTGYWPFAAIAAGRARLGGFRGHDIGGGILIWLAASWAHIPLGGWAAGVWRWIG